MNLHLFWDKILDFFALNNHTDETDDIIENPEISGFSIISSVSSV